MPLSGRSRLLPAAQSALIGNLDLPLAPFWVRLVFGQTAGRLTWIGGAIVALPVVFDMIAGQRGPAEGPS